MAAAPIVALAAGGVLNTFGSISQGNTAKAAGDYNANIAEAEANQVEQQTAEDERRFRLQTKKELGAIRAGYGASGVTSEGSPEEILAESAAAAELDALTLRYKGAVKAKSLRDEARLQRFYGKQGRIAGYLGAGGSALSTTGNILRK
jgi:hypothetical protein